MGISIFSRDENFYFNGKQIFQKDFIDTAKKYGDFSKNCHISRYGKPVENGPPEIALDPVRSPHVFNPKCRDTLGGWDCGDEQRRARAPGKGDGTHGHGEIVAAAIEF